MKSNLLFYYIKECTAVEMSVATFVQSETLNRSVRSRKSSMYLSCHTILERTTLGRMLYYIKPVYKQYCSAWRLPITDKGIKEIIL